MPLTVVSWNVHVGGGDLPTFVAALRAGALTGDRPVGHFVILMQEAFRSSAAVPVPLPAYAASPSRIHADPPSGPRDDILSQARALGLALYYAPAMRNGPEPYNGLGEDRGNAILSTLPLSDLAAMELPFDKRRRVAIAATVTHAPGTPTAARLRVASLHLDASAGPARLWLFASGFRAMQARQFLTTLDPQQPTILGSDLNTWSEGPREPAYTILRDWFTESPSPGLKHTFAFPWFRLDYLFYRLPGGWRTATWRAPSPFGSDHFPLIGQLESRGRRITERVEN
jgi:endonuclease/exonuclease/phosphatase family metal-dependent hydrolase